jgi:hypothetical protein
MNHLDTVSTLIVLFCAVLAFWLIIRKELP